MNPCLRPLRLTQTLLTLALALLSGLVQAQVSADRCGALANGIGPFDYRTEGAQIKHTVESAHFTPAVEGLVRGNTSAGPHGDLDYTLRAFPNHHRALVSIMRWTQRDKTEFPAAFNGKRPPECYFERAVRWQPDDVIVRMLYAQYLYFHKRGDEARRQLSEAASTAPDNALTQYNVGLIYLEAGDHAQALAQAHKAYAMGMPREFLRDRLKQAGHWKEPVEALPPGTTASAPAGLPGR